MYETYSNTHALISANRDFVEKCVQKYGFKNIDDFVREATFQYIKMMEGFDKRERGF